MAVYQLPNEPLFPDPEEAEPNGLIAVGGDLSPERLLAAYATGIFPWYEEGVPILWWSPNPRFVLYLDEFHVSRSLTKSMRRSPYTVRFDTAFSEVMRRCGNKPRPGQDGTWITSDMIDAYSDLHDQGFAHSAEAWDGDVLVGGVYGVNLGGVFFGESMFADQPDASKVAFTTLVMQFKEWEFDFVDCQMETEHLRRFGARPIPRTQFLEELGTSIRRPTRRGIWMS